MKIGSLFSGYGGLDMGVQAVLGGDVAWHVEYDKAPSRILAHHYPDVPNHGDVTTLDFTTVEPVDVLTGGYPCQPFSHAGKRKGTHDDRHLWPHVLRALCDLGPSLAVLENVRGHLTLGFDVVLADLASIGWSAEWLIVRASDAGAPHQRARLFIVAYPDASRLPLSQLQSWGEESGGRRHASVGTQLASQGGTFADASHDQQQKHQGDDIIVGEWAALGWRSVLTAGARGDGADPHRKLAGSHAPDGSAFSCDAGPTADAQLHGLNGSTLGRGASASQEEWRVRQPQGCHSQDWRDAPPATDADGASREHGVSGMVVPHAARRDQPATDADLTGRKAWRNAGQDGERIRVEPLGPAQPVADPHLAGPQGREPAGRRDVSTWGDHGPAIPLADAESAGAAVNHGRLRQESDGGSNGRGTEWGDYGPAIARWERVTGRPAPAPTEPGRTGAPRLSPAFVEWMMGLPSGWVTDPAIGISRNDQLKALGNGVVPQQARLALSLLLPRVEAVAS